MPPGIPYIIGNEAAERFSFYGMRTILVVFMAQYLHFMDGGGGAPLTRQQAVEYYHQFASWVYFTPLLGALIADIFLGKYLTILLLSIVYCLGHAALACMGSFGNSPWWLFAGLLLICLGSGGIKPCVSAHVGDQFGKSNHHLHLPDLQLVLLLHQLRLVLLHAADAVAVGKVRAALGVRRARRADGHRHLHVLAGAAPLRPHPAGRQRVFQRGVLPRGHRRARQADPVVRLHRGVLVALRPDRLLVGASGAADGSAVPRHHLAGIPDPGGQPDPDPRLHPAVHLRHLSVDQPAFPAHAAAQDRPRHVPDDRVLRR